MRKFMATRSREDGFTMVELLVVVIIIAILAAIAVPVYIGVQNSAKHSAMDTDLDTTKTNIAAALTEDGNVTSGVYTAAGAAGDAQVQNSGVSGDETATVTINQDKSFSLSYSSAKLGYTVSYISATGTLTRSSSGVSGASSNSGPLSFNFEDPSQFGTAFTGGSLTTAQAHGGSHSLMGHWDNNFNSDFLRLYPALTPGTTYTVSGYYYISLDSGHAWSVNISGLGSGMNPFPNSINYVRTGAWYPFSFTGTATSTNSFLEMWGGGGQDSTGTFYLDDVTFTAN